MLAAMAASVAAAGEIVREVRVHGHRAGSEAAILALAEVAVGDDILATTLDEVEARLMASGRFSWVEVRKRYRSLTAFDEVAILIAVKENPRLRDKLQLLPDVGHDDAYGFSFGARVGLLDALGAGERMTLGGTWGGEHVAAVEVGRATPGRALDDVRAFALVRHRDHPHDGRRERRAEVGVTVLRALGRGFVDAGWTWIDAGLGEESEPFSALELGVGLDTRGDRAFPRDGVYLRGGFRRLFAIADGARSRFDLEARGYRPLAGRAITVLRLWAKGGAGVPASERPWIGGTPTLRGHRPGAELGDRAAGLSVEIRLPLTAPVGLGRAGIAAFFDTAAAWSATTAFAAADFGSGAGIGVFADATLFNARADLATDLAGRWRVHVQSGVRF